ncbi:MAG TPA: hypothetical protein VES92_08980 [Nitrospiraceae bacterium]|nr:hypothetical protein [Nitrospiraceae bacterium]
MSTMCRLSTFYYGWGRSGSGFVRDKHRFLFHFIATLGDAVNLYLIFPARVQSLSHEAEAG